MSTDTWNLLVFVGFTGLTLIASVSTGLRIYRLWRARIALPILIWRDLSVTGGLTLSFVMIAAHRAAGLPFADNLWFYVVSSIPALTGMFLYVYFELFVIGHGLVREFIYWARRYLG